MGVFRPFGGGGNSGGIPSDAIVVRASLYNGSVIVDSKSGLNLTPVNFDGSPRTQTSEYIEPLGYYKFTQNSGLVSIIGSDSFAFSSGLAIPFRPFDIPKNNGVVFFNTDIPSKGIIVIDNMSQSINNTLWLNTIPISGGLENFTDAVLRVVLQNKVSYQHDNHVFNCGDGSDNFSDVIFTDSVGNDINAYIHGVSNCRVSTDGRLPHNTNILILPNGDLLSSPSGSTMQVSRNNGETWQNVSATSGRPCFVDSDGNIYASTSRDTASGTHKIVRCPSTDNTYQTWVEVLDISSSSGIGLPFSFAEDSSGNIYFGRYQEGFDCAIYKSTNQGVSFTRKFTNSTYQHVHGLYVDLNQTPNAIYAGLDGASNAVTKSTDAGETWSLMVGCIAFNQMVSGAGYRLFSGESTIIGGAAIVRTTDDATYTTVLNSCQTISGMVKLGAAIYAFGASNYQNRWAQIYRSVDEGLTWETVYFSPYQNQASTSSGWRYASLPGIPTGETEPQIIVGSLDSPYSPLRIVDGGDNWQALAFVQIPYLANSGGSFKIKRTNYIPTVTSNPWTVFPDNFPEGALFRVPIDEGSSSIMDIAGGKTCSFTPTTGSWQSKTLPPSGTIRPVKAVTGKSMFKFVPGGKVKIDGSGADPLLNVTRGFTLIAWVTATSSSATLRYVAGRGAMDTAGSITLGYRGQGSVNFRGGLGNLLETMSFNYEGRLTRLFLFDGGVHMIGIQVANSESPKMKFIFDGMLEDNWRAYGTHITSSAINWQIGSDLNNAYGQDGIIHDVALFGRELTAREIMASFERTSFIAQVKR